MDIRNPKAVCLVSGGLDSATSTAVARFDGYDLYCLSFDYGQRHRKELSAARNVAASLGAKDHKFVRFDLRQWGGSALTDDIDVPTGRSADEISQGIPVTYVPARNAIFLSFAIGYAETIGAQHIYIGVNQLDYSGYPDCRREFLDAFEKAATLGTKAGNEIGQFVIKAPLAHLTKADIIRLGTRLGVDYSLTWSCYLGEERPCGRCDSCILRAKGFSEAGIPDPALLI